jgi:hypothetical protein
VYLRVPDHGDPHLLPCCGYLLWRSRGLNTDSWRPPWGGSSRSLANSKDLHLPRSIYSAQTQSQLAVFEFKADSTMFTASSRQPAMSSTTSKSAPCQPAMSVRSTKIKHQCRFLFSTLVSRRQRAPARTQLPDQFHTGPLRQFRTGLLLGLKSSYGFTRVKKIYPTL